MDDGLKQRLIGAVVLVLVAIIFIPMLFDDNKTRPEDIMVDIPRKPDMPKLEIRQPERPGIPTPKAQATQPSKMPTATDQLDITKESVAKKRIAWTVQLASFAELKNAEALRDRLRNAGHKSYIKYRPDKTPTLIQVFVGPELSRADVDRLKANLDEQFKLQGIVVRYDP